MPNSNQTNQITAALTTTLTKLSTQLFHLMSRSKEVQETAISRVLNTGASVTAIVKKLESHDEDEINADAANRWHGGDEFPAATAAMNKLRYFHENGTLAEHVALGVNSCHVMQIHNKCDHEEDDCEDDARTAGDVVALVQKMTTGQSAHDYLPSDSADEEHSFESMLDDIDLAKMDACRVAQYLAGKQEHVGLEVVQSAMYIATSCHLLSGEVMQMYHKKKHIDTTDVCKALGDDGSESVCPNKTTDADDVVEEDTWSDSEDEADAASCPKKDNQLGKVLSQILGAL